jgi:hypothetical protein
MMPQPVRSGFALRWWFGAAMLLSTLSGAPAAEHRIIRFPDIPGYRTLKGDFHQHTVFSDGKVWPNIRVEEGMRDGLDAMSVTEHLEWQPHQDDLPNPNRNRSFEIARQAASLPAGMSEGDYWLLEQRAKGREQLIKDQKILVALPPGAPSVPAGQDILVFNGVEITRNHPQGHVSPLGHVNAIFIRDANRLVIEEPVALLREAVAQGAFNIWNHPWSRGSYNVDGVVELTELHQKLLQERLIQGIEVVNTDTYSEGALQLALDHDLTIMSGSDIHSLVEWVYPADSRKHRPVTLIFATEKTADSIKEALLQRRTVVWYKNTLIGREAWLKPLIAASLDVRSKGYQPDRRKFTIQDRPDSALLDIELKNTSDANFLLRNAGSLRLYNEAEVLSIPPHTTLTVTVMTLSRAREVELNFEVLNAVTAPRKHPMVSYRIPID